MAQLECIKLSIHGIDHNVHFTEVTPETRLVEYLRNFELLRGTKYMCLEGGCGSCIVSITKIDPITRRERLICINSCLVSIYQCNGWTIHTVEGIGNKKQGFHPIQKALAHFNATQCGFCTPGWVMGMYPLYESGTATMEQIETNFGGNICRCTGYRPILAALKTFATDSKSEELQTVPDIEEVGCPRTTSDCKRVCSKSFGPAKCVVASKSRWYKVYNVKEIFDVFKENADCTYRLVGGNTARGVYTPTIPDIYIDISDVSSLTRYSQTKENLVLGANMNLTETLALFQKVGKENSNFSYLIRFAEHLEKIASVPVRNIATLAGNLSVKYQHNEFPSDIFMLLESLGATLTIVDIVGKETNLTPREFLSYNMTKKVITKISLRCLDPKYYKFISYKIMPIAQNSHAIINAGFLFRFDGQQKVESASIVYGGISPKFVHPTKTETFLNGKKLFDDNVLQKAYGLLDEELVINYDDETPHFPSAYLKGLSVALFYKAVLSMAPEGAVRPRHKSGAYNLHRPISKGTEEFPTSKSVYPLTQPIPKIEALAQASGELEYITDMIELPGQLAAYFVNTNTTPMSYIDKVDVSEALAIEGVVAYLDKNDIPGKNSFTPANANFPSNYYPENYGPIIPEEIFCSGLVQYYYQPVGMVVAVSQEIAITAASLVKITYKSGSEQPLFTIRQILKAGDKKRLQFEGEVKANTKGDDVKHVIKGTHDTCFQYHYHMETQNCMAVPTFDGLDVYPGTQWIDYCKVAIAEMLNIFESKINVSVKRLGGSYGGKIVRSTQIACATALAAHKLQRPVYMRLLLRTNMDMVGKRYAASTNYEVGVDDNGTIQYLNYDYWLDYASGNSENFAYRAMEIFYTSYKHDTWNITANHARTNNPASSFCRAPGHCNVFAMVEAMMDHIATYLNKSPLDVRLANMDPNQNAKTIQYIDRMKKWSDFESTVNKIQQYNKENRWMKKAISLVPMTYPFRYLFDFHAMVSIFAADGSVAVTHGGVETGQGINTKVAQVTAFCLDIPLDLVSIKETRDITSPNNYSTAASMTSESVCYAIIQACDILRTRMDPVRKKMNNPTWQQLVKQCQLDHVDLFASWMFAPSQRPDPYLIYGVVVSEVEVDILTGNHIVTRVDLIEDVGDSISPMVDIGQIEGAFIMGLGYWTTENLIYNKSGKLLTDTTWNYKVPGAQDIPVNFRVEIPKNNPNPVGVLHSKAVGEPPLCLATSVPLALRQAIASARDDSDPCSDKWVPIHGPTTPATVFLGSLNNYKQYTL